MSRYLLAETAFMVAVATLAASVSVCRPPATPATPAPPTPKTPLSPEVRQRIDDLLDRGCVFLGTEPAPVEVGGAYVAFACPKPTGVVERQ